VTHLAIPSRRLTAACIAALLFAISFAAVPACAAEHKSCKLLTAAELEPVTGKVGEFNSFAVVANSETCLAKTANGTVTLRLTKQEPQPAAKGKGVDPVALEKIRERSQKAQPNLEIKNFGDMACSKMSPRPGREAMGYTTMCVITKGNTQGAVTVMVKNAKDAVSMDALHSVAQKMVPRI
jgi:hypothetical protein